MFYVLHMVTRTTRDRSFSDLTGSPHRGCQGVHGATVSTRSARLNMRDEWAHGLGRGCQTWCWTGMWVGVRCQGMRESCFSTEPMPCHHTIPCILRPPLARNLYEKKSPRAPHHGNRPRVRRKQQMCQMGEFREAW